MTKQLTDPVCGMTVTPASEHHHAYHDTDYYFCSQGCQTKFTADPEHYLNLPAPTADTTGTDSKTYTCPMHPEIQQTGPGSCPKCGMALETITVELEEDSSELDDMTRRFWVSTVLALPVLVLRWWRTWCPPGYPIICP